ncbi:MAG: ferrochelatase, partial [Xanthomonadales bacterium]|nr:ferrochelatase [Xanthomonadales bacterium]
QIWMPGGSPLAVHTAALADAVARRLPGWRVAHAMRYGQPSVQAVFDSLRAEGVRVERGRVRRPAGPADLDAALWGPD